MLSHADQVTVTYILVGIGVGLVNWLADSHRTGSNLMLSLVVALAGAFGVEILLDRLFGIYATFGSIDSLIGTSVIKSATGATLTVLLMRLVLHFARPLPARR